MLFVGPGRLSLAKLEQLLAGQFDAPFRIEGTRWRRCKKITTTIVLDTPPSLGILTVNALVCSSTHLLVPIQAAYFAIEGTDDLLETYERIRARPNPGLKMLGVVITLFDKRTNISARYTRTDSHGVRRNTIQDQDQQECAAGRESRIPGSHFDLRPQITGCGGVQEIGRGGYSTC